MRLNDVWLTKNSDSTTVFLKSVAHACSSFISESGKQPVFKRLNEYYDDFAKVKVRYKKTKNEIAKTFNEAFKQEINNLHGRAVFVESDISSIDDSTFYVFPVNGYRYLYTKEVKDSSNEYKEVFETLINQFEDKSNAFQLITDLLKYTYVSENLHEGIKFGSEIIFYNMPFYYAVRTTVVEDYDELITSLEKFT